MVVLATAILAKSGQVLVSRQFLSMTRTRIEGLLVAFPKLIGTDSQHTFVETDSVRYVYQPLEQLYLVLITNKQSNIMEDLETLKLLSKIIAEYVEGYTEANIKTAAFDLIFAFDEVLALGYKENITLQQVKTFMEMDSHEERLFNIIQTSKIDEAREAAKRKAEEIARLKEEARQQSSLRPGASSYSSYSSSSYTSNTSPRLDAYIEDEEEPGATRVEEIVPKVSTKKPTSSDSGPKRMVLGKTKKTQDEFVDTLVQEDKLVVPEPEEEPEPPKPQNQPPPQQEKHTEVNQDEEAEEETDENEDVEVKSPKEETKAKAKGQDKRQCVQDFLAPLKLLEYVDTFLEAGYDNRESILTIELDDLKEINIKKGHQRIILNAIKALQGDSS